MAHRILVVDDDRNIGQILHASLATKGYEVFVVRNGEDALGKFASIKPDLVLLDVLLPKMNGWEVCKAIKAKPEGSIVPVVMMSAVYKTPKMQRDAKGKYGADEFVEKPFQLSRLLEIISGFIGVPEAPETREVPAREEGVAQDDAGEKVEKAPEEIALEGELASIPFPELLHTLYVMGKSGRLLMKFEGVVKEIDVMEGYPVSVTTSLPAEYLGNFLVRMGVITEEIAVESVKKMQSSGRLQGTVLLEMGLLTPQQLVNYLRMQVREKLFEIFSWHDGTYRFNADPKVAGDIQNVDMSVANIINEGIRLHYNYERLEPMAKRYGPRFLHLGTNRRYRFQDLCLLPAESKILDGIDGTKTFDTVFSASKLPRERSLQILYTLVVSGMVEPVTESREDPQTALNYGEAVVREAQELAQAIKNGGKTAEVDAGAEKKEPKEKAEAPKEKASPKPEPAAPEDDESLKTRRRVMELYEKLTTHNFFQVLGVSDNPTEHEVRVAYHKMAREFHPDRFFGKSGPEMKSKVEEIFRAINEAYDHLNTQKKIIDYKNELADQGPEDAETTRIKGVKDIILAEQRFQSGLSFLKEHRYTRAAHAFGESLKIAPNEAEYIAYYGWALYNIPFEKDPDEEELALRPKESAADLQFEAREALNRSLSINPRTEKAYLFLGAIYKRQGLGEFAEKQYEKALICNPNSIEALRELRLIKLKEQQQTQQKKTGFFDRLFKKKSPVV